MSWFTSRSTACSRQTETRLCLSSASNLITGPSRTVWGKTREFLQTKLNTGDHHHYHYFSSMTYFRPHHPLGSVTQPYFRWLSGTQTMAESEEELKSLLMRVKKKSEKSDLKLNIKKKTRSWYPVPYLHGKQMGKKGNSDRLYFLGLQNPCGW